MKKKEVERNKLACGMFGRKNEAKIMMAKCKNAGYGFIVVKNSGYEIE